MADIELTETEQVAKQFLLKCFTEGFHKADDDNKTGDLALPAWYNKATFQRGQKYFHENRFAILESNFCGLLTLLAEPTSLKVLAATGKSSLPETARRRYVSTIQHVLTWYKEDLQPGSKSWESLKKVRKMHCHASKLTKSINIGGISQTELALTTFGFMGLALVRPHCLSIKHDNQEDRNAFAHFWAVIGSMIGVLDEFNLCLLSMDAIETVCLMIMRYFFIPFLQYESPQFKSMVNALLKGMSQFLPFMTYDYQMFKIKYVVGVPGYQYKYNKEKDKVCRQLFSKDELAAVEELLKTRFGFDFTDEQCWKDQQLSTYETCDECHSQAKLFTNKSLLIREVIHSNTDWHNLMNDFYFHQLNKAEKFKFKIRDFLFDIYQTTFGWYTIESGTDLIQFSMRRYQKRLTRTNSILNIFRW